MLYGTIGIMTLTLTLIHNKKVHIFWRKLTPPLFDPFLLFFISSFSQSFLCYVTSSEMVIFVFLHNIELIVRKSLKFFFGILTTTNIDIKLSLLANKDSTSSWVLSKIAYVNASNKKKIIIMTYHWLGTRFELCFSKIKMIIIILVTKIYG